MGVCMFGVFMAGLTGVHWVCNEETEERARAEADALVKRLHRMGDDTADHVLVWPVTYEISVE